MVHHLRTTCRACGAADPRRFLSLGETALANAFPVSAEEFAAERRFPLDVYVCERCWLVQLLDVIDPEYLFRNYIYVTGTSDTIASHNVDYARTVVDLLRAGAGDLVVEVASNDGSLLACFQQHGVRTLGVEPATNIAEMARARGVETENVFFDADAARALRERHGPARAVIANNVLAHVDEPKGFLAGARELVADDGLVVIEVPYLGEFLERLEYDTVYHEHLCYFSVSALVTLYREAGLSLVSIDQVPVHGGSLRLFARRRQRVEHSPEVLAMVESERAAGLCGLARYERFAADVAEQRRALLALLNGLEAEGKSLAGYGAPAKGNTLLAYCGIGPDLIPYTVDKNPKKVGKFTPGQHIPVLPANKLLERQPDVTLILAWNFAAEIMQQQAEYARRGGRFILPLPEPRIV